MYYNIISLEHPCIVIIISMNNNVYNMFYDDDKKIKWTILELFFMKIQNTVITTFLWNK